MTKNFFSNAFCVLCIQESMELSTQYLDYAKVLLKTYITIDYILDIQIFV